MAKPVYLWLINKSQVAIILPSLQLRAGTGIAWAMVNLEGGSGLCVLFRKGLNSYVTQAIMLEITKAFLVK